MSGAAGCRILLAATLALLIPSAARAGPIPAGAEVISDGHGPVAYRLPAPRGGWYLPEGDAVLIDEGWWTPMRPLPTVEGRPTALSADLLDGIRGTRLTAWSMGDITLDGTDELVVSFRRPFKRNHINRTRPRRVWVDEEGLSAHLGLYRPSDLSEVWVAGTLVSPVVDVAACDGGVAVAYGELDDPAVTESSAWRWVVFGFVPMEPLPGPGTPTCVDIDRDGRTEPAITGRS
ncbi:MAG: hypothetical protein AB1Z67_14065 [Candidatus Limnocylindrales bacterium]